MMLGDEGNGDGIDGMGGEAGGDWYVEGTAVCAGSMGGCSGGGVSTDSTGLSELVDGRESVGEGTTMEGLEVSGVGCCMDSVGIGGERGENGEDS